jgi:hypothetical protein
MKFNESGQNYKACHLENKLEEQAYLPINIDKNVLFSPKSFVQFNSLH